MWKIFVRWLVGAVPVLFLVSLITFVLSALVPGNAGRLILGITATQEQVDALNAKLGVDRPLVNQYIGWLGKALHGDLGQSIISGEPVTRAIGNRLPVTLSLIVGSVLLAAILGIGLGLLSALRGGWAGRLVDIISIIGIAVPGFWFGLVLVAIFAVKWTIFPATGYVPISDSFSLWFESLVLPVITLGIPAAAPVAKQARDGILRELEKPYVTVLRARGIRERRVLFVHVLRNAAVPVVTILGIVSVVLLGGTALAETVFQMPGLGGMAVGASAAHDIPPLQGIAIVFTLIVMIINLIIEFAYGLLDPKVRT